MAIDQVETAEAAVDGLLSADLSGLDHHELLGLTARFEVLKRRMAVVDHRLVAELGHRKVAVELCQPSTAAVLRGLLRITRARRSSGFGPPPTSAPATP